MDARQRAQTLSCWRRPVRIERLPGGLTNTNFIAHDGAEKFVVRIGDDIPVHHVLRSHELAATRAAHAAGLGPEVVHAEPGALVLRFVDGRTLTAADIARDDMLPRIATLLRRCHQDVQEHMRGPAMMFWPFHIVRDYAATLAAADSPWRPEVPRLLAMADRFERALGPVAITFAHNDLLAANIIDDGARLWLIDWEYSGFGAAAFDLANLASNNGFDDLLDEALQRHYLGHPPDSEAMRRHAAMRAVSLLREAMWGMVSQAHSALDIDYRSYAAEHLVKLDAAMSAVSFADRP